jgi:hypothetical protein
MFLEPSKVKAVDFDGTIGNSDAFANLDYYPEKVGPPIDLMVQRVKAWLKEGIEVIIFTARVHPVHGEESIAKAEQAIKDFCVKVFGRELEITCLKDPRFDEIWDDKAVRVEQDTGLISNQNDIEDPLVQNDAIGDFICDK